MKAQWFRVTYTAPLEGFDDTVPHLMLRIYAENLHVRETFFALVKKDILNHKADDMASVICVSCTLGVLSEGTTKGKVVLRLFSHP